MLVLIILCSCFFASDVTQGYLLVNKSYSSSVVKLTNLFHIESECIKYLRNYIEVLQYKINLMQFVLDEMQYEQQRFQNNPELHISNPLNGFALMRRMHLDWNIWLSYMKAPMEQNERMAVLYEKFPDNDDYIEALRAIPRIQSQYLLKGEDMAKGLIFGKQYNYTLPSFDCHAIGLYLHKKDSFLPYLDWFQAALAHYDDSREAIYELMGGNRAVIWRDLSLGLLHKNKPEDALVAINKALQYRPHDQQIMSSHNTMTIKLNKIIYCKSHKTTAISKFQCRYNTFNAAFLKLAPLKYEQLQQEPYIVLYHNVISESEIFALKNMKRGSLQVESHAGNVLLERLNRLVGDMIGFTLRNSKSLKLINYGIGGLEGNHTAKVKTYYGKFLKQHTREANNAQTFATVQFHLSDVRKGGATIFPLAQTIVQLQKGSALIWHNLDGTGNINPKALHAMCPVLIGSKWVAIKKINVYDACDVCKNKINFK